MLEPLLLVLTNNPPLDELATIDAIDHDFVLHHLAGGSGVSGAPVLFQWCKNQSPSKSIPPQCQHRNAR